MEDGKRDVGCCFDVVSTSAISIFSHTLRYFCPCQMAKEPYHCILAYSCGDYLKPFLTTLDSILIPLIYCCHPPFILLRVIFLVPPHQNSPNLVAHLGYFFWSISSLDMYCFSLEQMPLYWLTSKVQAYNCMPTADCISAT